MGPFGWPGLGRAVAGHAAAAGQLALVLLAAYGAGGPAARLLALPVAGWERAGWRLLAGCGTIGVLQHGLGLAGLYARPLLGAELAAWVIAGALAAVRDRRTVGWAIPGEARWPAGVAAVAMLAAFAVARLPDTHEDPRLYHLAAPESYLLEHKIHLMLRNFNWHMPRGAEMLWLPAFAFGGLGLAKLVTVAMTLTAGLFVGRLAAAAGAGPAGTWWAAAVFLGGGQVLNQCWQPKNDMALALCLVAAALAALRWARNGGRWAGAAALACGLAAGVKFQAAFFLVALGLGVVRRGAGRFGWTPLAIAAATAAAGSAGWFAESWLFLGNPVHPFASGWFPDLYFKPGYLAVLHRVQLDLSPPAARSAWDLYGAVWRVVGEPANGGPALFVLLPLAVLTVRGPAGGFLRMAGVTAWLLWILTERVARYMLPDLAWLAALAGAGLAATPALPRWAGWRDRALAALVVVPLAVNLGVLVAPHGWAVLAGRLDPDAFFHESYTTWDDARRWLNATVRPRARVLLGGEMRRLWLTCRVDSDGGNFASFPWQVTRESRTAAEARKKFRQAGYAYLAYNFVSAEYRFLHWTPGEPWDDRQLRLYTELVRTSFRPVRPPVRYDNLNGGFWVFAVEPRAGGPYPVHYLPFTEGMFRDAYDLNREQRYPEALAAARAVRARMPGCHEADMITAMFLVSTGRFSEARDVLRRANATGFVGDGNWSYLGTAELRLGRYAEGLKDYARLWDLKRDGGGRGALGYGFFRLGKAWLDAGNPRRALPDLEQAVFNTPDVAVRRYALALALHALGRDGDARREAAAAAALEPDNPTFATYAGWLRDRAGGRP